MISKPLLIVIGTAAMVAAPASAAVVVSTLPDFNGPEIETGFPIDLGVIGAFNFSIPTGSVITGATLGGTYGTEIFLATTAPFNGTLEGYTLTLCDKFDINCTYDDTVLKRPFSYDLPSSIYASLLDGSADLSLNQTGSVVIRYGTPTLTISYTAAAISTAVPEPTAWAMMIGGLGLVGAAARRRRHALKTA